MDLISLALGLVFFALMLALLEGIDRVVTAQGWCQIALYVAILTALTPLIGAYMYRVYTGERVVLTRVLGPVERVVYRLLRSGPEHGQDWMAYARTALVFSGCSSSCCT